MRIPREYSISGRGEGGAGEKAPEDEREEDVIDRQRPEHVNSMAVSILSDSGLRLIDLPDTKSPKIKISGGARNMKVMSIMGPAPSGIEKMIKYKRE